MKLNIAGLSKTLPVKNYENHGDSIGRFEISMKRISHEIDLAIHHV